MAAYIFGVGLVLFHVAFLFLSTCDDTSGGDSPQPFEVQLTFTPTTEGFVIGSQSDFDDLTSLRITAISGNRYIGRIVNITEFIDGNYSFTGLDDQSNWIFSIRGIFSDGSERDGRIDFIWEENRVDHVSGGLRSGTNTDGDRRADSVDDDDDNDGILDVNEALMVNGRDCRLHRDCDNDGIEEGKGDRCPFGEASWASNNITDNDGDGCRDAGEDTDDDNDGLSDNSDQCPVGATGWTSNPSTDNDGDGCRDADEDTDDDNDLLIDAMDTGMVDSRECRLHADCDNDEVGDNSDLCRVGVTGWTSNPSTDNDRDGCRDADEDTDDDNDGHVDLVDIDDDGDGLIEIGTEAELDGVRYALDGAGKKLSMNGMLNTTGCGDGNSITSCSGYELITDISLAAYSNGEGWQPLGNDIDSSTDRCQGAPFSGTFEGNGWAINELNISRSAEDCVGLFGHIAASATIRNLTLYAETVIGKNKVGGLVGDGLEGARIVSSSVGVKEIIGINGSGGLLGGGINVTIISSSVVVEEISGSDYVGGLVGNDINVTIISSSVVVEEISGSDYIGGLVGNGFGAQIISSSVLLGNLRGRDRVGGLVGFGSEKRIISSSVVAGLIRGNSDVGGILGAFYNGALAFSYAITGPVSGNSNLGAIIGDNDSNIAVNSSYWDNETSGRNNGNPGEAKTTSELRTPTDYTGIYASWNDDTDIFGDGMSNEPLAVWCDKDHSGSIEPDERTNDNLVWDFGNNNEYPAIRCTPISPAEWRSWWFLNGTSDPELNQTRLDDLLPP